MIRRAARWLPLLVFGLACWLNGSFRDEYETHTLVARAFLAGRVWFELPTTFGFEAVPRPEGGWISPFPPVPALPLVPFVAVGIEAVEPNLLAALAGVVAVWLMWTCLEILGVERRARIWLTVGFAVGSELLWVAMIGGQHLYPQALAAALLIGALRLGLEGRLPILAGLLVGLAGASRLPVALAMPLVLFLFPARHWPAVVAGFAVPMAGFLAYDVIRFGSPFELGYDRIVGDYGHVLDEPWYEHGITSIAYIPRSLATMLFSGFGYDERPPWFRPELTGTSILLTMPILIWIAGARGRLAVVAGLTAAVVMLPDLLHGNPGYSQFGYRFIVDALPILWLMLGLALRDHIDRPAAAAIAIGIVVNLYGVVVRTAGLFP